MDNLTPARLIGFINESLKKRDVEIGQIEILKSFSFFEIDKNFTPDVLEKMNGVDFNDRNVIVEVTAKPKGGGGGRRRSSNKGGGFGNKDSKFKRNDEFKPRRKKPAESGGRRKRR